MTCASNPCVVVVRATDAGDNTADQTIHVTVTDADEFNVGSSSDTDSDANTLAEDVANGASAEITASATDADGTTNTVTYAINSQSCSGAFAINSGTGAVTVADTSAIDYESGTTCTITVRATSADGSTSDTTFTVTITDVDDVAPTFTSSASITIAENVRNAVDPTVTDSDSSSAPTYTLSGTDSALFEVNSGTLRFVASAGQNFESMTCASNPCAHRHRDRCRRERSDTGRHRHHHRRRRHGAHIHILRLGHDRGERPELSRFDCDGLGLVLCSDIHPVRNRQRPVRGQLRNTAIRGLRGSELRVHDVRIKPMRAYRHRHRCRRERSDTGPHRHYHRRG